MASITFKHVEKTYPGNVTVVPDLNLEIQDRNSLSWWAPPAAASPPPCG